VVVVEKLKFLNNSMVSTGHIISLRRPAVPGQTLLTEHCGKQRRAVYRADTRAAVRLVCSCAKAPLL
jgi:hypothetical protein